MKKLSVSVVISAFNEEKKIGDCLASVAWAEEIIVIDNESTDKSAKIAEKYGAIVYTRKNNRMLNINKNFGFTKATQPWILSLDADERVTSELAEEIKSILNRHSGDEQERGNQNQLGVARMTEAVGFWIPRKNIIFGKWMQHTGWYPDYQLRLFKKSKGKFPEKHVHEMLSLDGEADYLQHPMVHYNYDSLTQFLQKTIVIYAPEEAYALTEKGYIFNYLDAIRFPFKEFLSRFFAREGYKDGFHGLMISLLMAAYHLIVFANLWEMQGFKDPRRSNILRDVEQEVKHSSKQLLFWFSAEKLKQTSDPLRKLFLKAKRKINSL